MTTLVDLSHPIRDGMRTHPGIPEPHISTFLSHEASKERYAPGTTFEITRIDMIANTGTYLDTPAHRYAGEWDLGALELERVVDLDGVIADLSSAGLAGADRTIDARRLQKALGGAVTTGRAVLIRTGWDRHWGTDAYLSDNPFLTADAARWLADQGVAVVGIDSLNVDSLGDPSRPAHTAILAAGIPIVEHMAGLDRLPPRGFRFFAVPPRIEGMATFPVRAFAIVS
jgi:arylformamidase